MSEENEKQNEVKESIDKPCCAVCGRPFGTPNVAFFQLNHVPGFICTDCITGLYNMMPKAADYINAQIDAGNAQLDSGVEVPMDVFAEEPAPKRTEAPPASEPLSTPSQLKAYLDQYIEGQDEAKRVLAVAIYNHYTRLAVNAQYAGKASDPPVEIEKSNVMLLGPTGVGKTAMLRCLAKKLSVPFVTVDATGYTSSGYVGKDVESIMKDLLVAAQGNLAKAEQGIVYIDEIDKISRKGESLSTTADPGHEGTQQALLKLLEGSRVEVPDGRRINPELSSGKYINTDSILFVCGGAFEGIEQIIAKRLNKNLTTVGFGSKIMTEAEKADYNRYIVQATTEDLRRFGLLPEIIGRIPVIAPLKRLTKEQLVAILTRPRNALLKQYQALLKHSQVELRVTDAALDYVAEEAMRRKTGARGLRGILEDALNPVMYEAPDRPGSSVVLDVKDGNLATAYTESKATAAAEQSVATET